MNIDKTILRRIAVLARLELSSEEEKVMLTDINKIVNWIEKLEEVNTDGVVPLVNVSFANVKDTPMNDDVPQSPLAHKSILVNAPKKDSNYIRCPKNLFDS